MLESNPAVPSNTSGRTSIRGTRTVAGRPESRAVSAPVAALVAGLVTFGLLLVIYGLTMAPDLSWANDSQDGGELITAAVTLGIPHPPGYPTYVAIGKLFSLLPVGTVAFRFNLLSAVAMAGAAGLLSALLAMRGNRSWTAMFVAISGGATFGLLPIVWSQATITEVYGLNALFVAAFLMCLIGLRAPLAAGIFLGLAITSHLSSSLLLPMAFFVTPRHQHRRLIGGTLVGLLPLLLLPILAQSGSPVIWGAPQTVQGWWSLVTGRLYHPNVFLPSLNSIRSQVFAPGGIWPALVIVGLGLAVAIVNLRASTKTDERRLGFATGLTAMLYGLFVLLYQTADAYVLLIPALLLLTFVMIDRLPLPGSLAALVPVLLIVIGFNQQNLRDDALVRPLAEVVLDAAPPNAILIAPGDRTIFTLWYFHQVENQRPDLILVDENLLAFDWYRERLQHMYPALNGLASDNPIGFRTTNQSRDICEVGMLPRPAGVTAPGYTYRIGAEQQTPFLMCQEIKQ